MKNQDAILEYSVTAEENNWGFRFKDSNGQVLINSNGYPSLAQAEQGFLSLVKSIATNQYSVTFPSDSTPPPKRQRTAQ